MLAIPDILAAMPRCGAAIRRARYRLVMSGNSVRSHQVHRHRGSLMPGRPGAARPGLMPFIPVIAVRGNRPAACN